MHAGNDCLDYYVDGDDLLISVRGSDDFKDWLENANLKMTHVRGIGFHSGFYQAAHDLWVKICSSGILNDYPAENIILTGHSKGGAIAQILAYLIHCENSEHRSCIHDVVTFGAPRCGNAKFGRWCKMYGVKHYRVVNNGDRVPYLPWIVHGFRHTVPVSLKLKGPWWRRLPLIGIQDHSMKDYLDKIEVW